MRADGALVRQALGGDMARIPGERPVDRHADSGLFRRRDHPVGVSERRGERLLDQNVDSVGRDLLDPLGVRGRRRAQDDQVRLGRPDAAVDIGKNPVVGDAERARAAVIRSISRVPYSDNLGVRMVMDFAEQIAHVQMVEIEFRPRATFA